MSALPSRCVNCLQILTVLKFLALLSIVSQASLALALDCVPNSISLSTQVEVDNFQETHGPCDHVVDYLTIWGDEITNMDGLFGLVSVGDSLQVFEAAALKTLVLPSLITVGDGLDVQFTPLITEIELSNLASVGGNLSLSGVQVLTQLDLSSLTFVGENLDLYYSALSNVDSLSSLIHVGGNVYVQRNPQLRECRGLDSLLDDIDDGLEGPGSELTDVPDVGGFVFLEENLSGCNSIDQVMTILSNGFESRFNTLTELDKNIGVTGRSSSIAVGEDGIPVIAYMQTDFYTDTTSLKVARCTDIKCTEAEISSVDAGTASATIAIGQDGLPVISYISYDEGLKVAKCNDLACSGSDETISLVDDWARDSALVIGPDGLPVLSYWGDGGLITVAKCNDNACSGGDEAINSIGQTGRVPSIAIASDGNPIIAYQESLSPFDANTKVAKCNDPTCAGSDETVTLISHTCGWVATSLSIAIGSDDLPLIAYPSFVTNSVTVTKCNDAACSGGDEIHSILETIDEVQNPSIAIGADGFPLIGYVDRRDSGGLMKIAKCNNHSCSEDMSRAIVDDEHQYESTSIALGEDGLPIISYYDSFARSLKVAHCESVSCQ